MLATTSSVVLRLTAFLFLRWIPGHHFPPVIFTSLVLYLSSLYSGSSAYNRNGLLKSLLTGAPSRRSWVTRLSVLINILCALFTADFLLRGVVLYPTTDLRFTRVGYVSPTSASILVREPDPAQFPLLLTIHGNDGDHGAMFETQTITIHTLDNSTDFTTTETVDNLQPATSYRYSISNNQTGSFTTSPSPDSRAGRRLSFLTSSCIKPNFPYDPRRHPLRIPGIERMTTAIASLSKPSFMLFLGDFIYIDVPQRFGSSLAHYRSEYRRVYSSPSWSFNDAISLPWIHTLDDHEIANDWNHGNATAPYPAAIDPYLHYHASVNPPLPLFSTPDDNVKKSYTEFTNGPAAFFLLDTRSYRDPEQDTILGAPQLAALLDFLARKEPPHIRWKFVASSVPFTANWHAGTGDTWGGFLAERAVVFDAMRHAQAVQGIRIVLLSGDRHEFAATRFPSLSTSDDTTKSVQVDEEEEGGQELIEFCVGPLNMFYLPIRTYYKSSAEDIPIKYLPDGNTKFGLIDIDDDDDNGDGNGNGNGNGDSILTYSLYLDETVVWRYQLRVPPFSSSPPSSPSLSGTKERGAVHFRLPAGKVILDESDSSREKWADSLARLFGWDVMKV